MIIQLIEKQKDKFCIVINEVHCEYKKLNLYTSGSFIPISRKLKKSTLGWYVNRKWVSYNQIKQIINK